MNRNLIHFLAVLSGSLVLSSCGNKNQQGQQRPGAGGPVPVAIASVPEEIVKGINNFPGTVVALNQTELRAEVNGYITAILVPDGATVTKGQKLYEIDRTRYQAAQEQAKANLAIAEANLNKVNRDVERYKRLAEQDAIAKQTLDYAMTDLNNAQAQVMSARAALTSASTDLERSVIRAPFNGTIGISQVRTGALVSAGTTLINTISSTNPIAVDFAVNERDIKQFVDLQSNSAASLKDSVITLQLSGNNTYEKPGRVTAIDRAVDPSTGTITVRATFDNPSNVLRAGMNANVLVAANSTTKMPIIPYQAVIEQLGEFKVYVVTDSSTVIQQPVKLGQKIADKVVINEGLQAGQQIVVEGTQNLQPGAKVVDQSKMEAQAPQGQGQGSSKK
ncbi:MULTISPECIES: efflux RND transporter periplasmic adaptor subunit [Olivibacter]|jgi:membrane fusion protein (multidrug efflux system)|uniref:Efflux RND transporter periplasmic adaptor subunit n=2 Tax=Olivibacter TaxID=376469 RepID=A0ABV6HKC1_9SPHI|nr:MULTISPECIES: efflux RND transporter periplasmic adaptor subunit [Olivibacter]MCL4638960.1 efflux RND transporter periplasmic adaptor subunit [Olivibacter sp. UJ_SKK_5.1]MDM8175374.1 efflux RND transporter periplasmic adaptor subunit [Olivibacter sp. 47]MDX3913989.1 efflux RND transporter periplasmic adaptor subunit [Pseudosphingobacterium sp.]QEL02136.1 efflux RND transporter periplasmic adaptor subunit [Olivibacter sp. LS-1]